MKNSTNKPNRKNVSKSVPNGRTLQTRDEFLASGKGKKDIKPNHPNPKDYYRRIGVVDSNKNGDLIVIKLDTKGKHSLPDYMSGKSKYKPLIEIEDCDGNRIRIDNPKFKQNSPKKDISKKDVSKIKKDCFKRAAPKTKIANRIMARKIKGRK